MIYAQHLAFNAGELSPLLDVRSDVSQHQSGCRTLENFLVKPHGAAERRPGTLFCAAAKYPDKAVRLIPFSFGEDDSYILEFGDGYLRFFRDGALLQSSGVPYELASPYLAADLERIKHVQSADILFLVHPDHAPRQLRRYAETNWTLEEFDFKFPPFLDPNVEDTTLTPSAASGDITITASAAVFEAGHVGSWFDLVHIRENSKISGSFTAVGNSATMPVRGSYNLITRGTWTGTIQLQRSTDNGGSWLDLYSRSSKNDWNCDLVREEKEDNAIYRVRMDDYTSGTCTYEFRNDNYYTHGLVRITAVNSPTVAQGTVRGTLGAATATREWHEGAWGVKNGYPCCITFHEERLLFGGSGKQPQTIWGSRTGEWDVFRTGDIDDDAICYTLVSDSINRIQWMVSHDVLMVGTLSGEFAGRGKSSDEPMTPSAISFKPRSNYGSGRLAAFLAGDVVLCFQRNCRKLRELAYSYEKDGYVSPDLTMLADHITGSGIVATALVQQPDTILWCVRADGVLVGLTYERDQQVVGWHRHTTQGRFESVAAIPGAHGDEVYVAVRRVVNGTAVRYIERFAPRDWSWIGDAVYMDCAIWKTPDATGATVSGLNHLEGMEVQLMADGAVQTPATVDLGMVPLEAEALRVLAGLAYESQLQPMPLDLALQDGTIQSRKKRVYEVFLRVHQSVGGEVRAGEGKWLPVISRKVEHQVNTAIPPENRSFKLEQVSGYQGEIIVEVRQRDPLPLTVISISPNFEVYQ